MGMEPLNSAMAFQAQPVQHAQQIQESKTKAGEEGREANLTEPSIVVDSTTAVIKRPAEREEGQYQDEEGSKEQQGKEPPYHEQIKKAVEQMNEKLQNSEAIYGIHEKTNRVMIKIVNKETKEVIKEIPPEKTLNMIAKIWEIAGILVDEKR